MERDEAAPETIRQPARGEPIKLPRPPLDWGDEEPDKEWEELYYRGLVQPPYRGRETGRELAKMVRSWKPIGKPISNEDLMCLLGRCQCSKCDERDRAWNERNARGSE